MADSKFQITNNVFFFSEKEVKWVNPVMKNVKPPHPLTQTSVNHTRDLMVSLIQWMGPILKVNFHPCKQDRIIPVHSLKNPQ